jgi:excisionase family DNA binding protein
METPSVSAGSTQVVPRRYYSMDEFAQMVGLSRSTIKTLIGQGKISVRRVGRRVLIGAEEADRL